MKAKSPPVTDHAVLRYLERVCGIDAERIRQRIWKQARGSAGSTVRRRTVGGITYVLSETGSVVTVLSTALPEPEPVDDT